MNSLRKSAYLCKGMVREAIGSPRVWCGYLIGFSGIMYGVFPFIKYTHDTVINVLEPLVILLSERSFVTFLLMGYFLIVCNAPFIDSRSELTILRTNRSCWADSMILYICFQTIMYYLSIFVITVIMAVPQGYWGNMWSKITYMISNFGSTSAAAEGVLVPQISFLKNWSVFEASFHSFMLLILYSLVMAIILFLGNLGVHKFVGSISAVILHFIGYLIISDSLFLKVRYSLLANGILAYHDSKDMFAPSFSYMLFILIIVVLYYVLHIVVRHCDLRKSMS